jgi:hypothetical protein
MPRNFVIDWPTFLRWIHGFEAQWPPGSPTHDIRRDPPGNTGAFLIPEQMP